MNQVDALYLLDRAQKIGFSQLHITRVSQRPTGFHLFGVHPDKHRGRITKADVERAEEAAQKGATT